MPAGGDDLLERDVARRTSRSPFGSPAASRALPGGLARLHAGGVDGRRGIGHQPTLDDVFLNLTGRSLREERVP